MDAFFRFTFIKLYFDTVNPNCIGMCANGQLSIFPSHAALAPAADTVYALWSFEPPAPAVLQKTVQLELQPAADTVSPTMVPVATTNCKTAAVTAPLLNRRRSTLLTQMNRSSFLIVTRVTLKPPKSTLWNIMFKVYTITLILEPPKYNTNQTKQSKQNNSSLE